MGSTPTRLYSGSTGPGKTSILRDIVVHRQAHLLQVVDALARRRPRADCTAGNNKAMRTAMIAMTTSSSISVKPRPFVRASWDTLLLGDRLEVESWSDQRGSSDAHGEGAHHGDTCSEPAPRGERIGALVSQMALIQAIDDPSIGR